MKSNIGYAVFFLTSLLCTRGIDCTSKTAECQVQPDPALTGENDDVSGTVTFTQEENQDVSIAVSLDGFDTADSDTQHGFHVHTDADIGEGCAGAGGHYNPNSVNHGLPTDGTRHVGDLGNVEEDGSGAVSVTFSDSVISLYGDQTIIGRTVVVHATEDIGSSGDASGSAGTRLACCVITEVNASTAGRASRLILMLGVMVTALLTSSWR